MILSKQLEKVRISILVIKLVLNLEYRELKNFNLLLEQCGESFDFSGDLIEVEQVYDKVYSAVQKALKKKGE